MEKIKNSSKGFTLLELLVVVLIIGILASIALPQYQMAVTKAKVASILPLMRRFKDALHEYNLQHGDYRVPTATTGEYLGVTWPSDWDHGTCGNAGDCENDYWYCSAIVTNTGIVECQHNIDESNRFLIVMFQSDDSDYEEVKGKTICEYEGTEGEKVCKALGGNFLDFAVHYDGSYVLN